jgi:DNA-binding SARP family transcriptional activator
MAVASGTTAAGIEIRLLGRFSARRDGEEIAPGAFCGRLVRRLIRMLASRPGEFASRDVLTEALWPVRSPADPSANLTVLVNRARRALGDPAVIVTGPGGYSFATEGCRVDATEFLTGVAAGRDHLVAGRAWAALEVLRAALDRWGGEPLPEDAYEDWAQEYRTRLSLAYVDALENAASAALVARKPRQAVLFAELAVRREPLREAAHLLLVRALAAAGDTAGALVAFDTLRHRLREDLGLDPSPEAFELQMHILRRPVQSPPRRPVTGSTPRTVDELPFVGREEELERTCRPSPSRPPRGDRAR